MLNKYIAMNMEPRVIIISENFYAGDAITGLNLFSKWDRNNLFIASRKTSFFYKNFKSGYLIGSSEIKFSFLFKFFNKVPKSRVIDCNIENPQVAKHAGKLISKIYLEYVVPVLKWTGLFSYRASYRVSQQFLTWVDNISPDCIYTSVGSLNMAEFIDDLMVKRPSIKYIIHGYDDWVEPNYYTISNAYTNRSLDLLNSIMSRSSITFATSDKMAHDYAIRYGREFITFPNPIEDFRLSKKESQRPAGITFIGKILNHNIKSILLLASSLSQIGSNITLHLYSEVQEDLRKKIMSKYSNIIFHGWVNHDDIPQILLDSQILYLPISVNRQTIKFTKYSMSTKMSEYLSSGVPVLYHGPSGIAMTEMLEKYQCAFIVRDNKESSLIEAIKVILEDKEQTNRIISNARNLFNEKFEKDKVSEEFKNAITRISLNKK